MVLQEMTKERRTEFRETFLLKNGQDYYQRKNIIFRHTKNCTVPTTRVIEKFKLTKDEMTALIENYSKSITN